MYHSEKTSFYRKRKGDQATMGSGRDKKFLAKCHKHIVGLSLPGKNECLQIISDCQALSGRSWSNVKDYVRNYKKKSQK